MKLKPVTWIIAGLLLYLVLLIAYLPATQVIGRLTLPQNLSISNVSGTIWNTQSEQIRLNGFSVEQVNWQLQLLPLLIGNVNIDIDGGNDRQVDQIAVQGELSISPSQKDYASAQDLTLFVPASIVANQLPLPLPVSAEGRVRLNIAELEYDQSCQQLTGTLSWLNANVEVSQLPESLELGNFDADLSCDNGDIIVKVKEPNKLGLAADVRIDDKFKYQLEGRFKPDASLPKAVHDASVIFGKKDPQGYYRLKL